MRTGELVGGTGTGAAGAPILITVERAAREALAAYLRTARFWVHAGEPVVGELSCARELALEAVHEDFPGPDVALTYPSASLAESVPSRVVQGFTPRPLEHTYDPASGSVLWYLGRSEGTIQLDLWADSGAMREALGASLPAVFNPSEDQAGVYLRLPPTYASATARFTLLTQQHLDPPDAVWAGERRLQVTIGYEAPLLARRRATLLRPRAPVEDL